MKCWVCGYRPTSSCYGIMAFLVFGLIGFTICIIGLTIGIISVIEWWFA